MKSISSLRLRLAQERIKILEDDVKALKTKFAQLEAKVDGAMSAPVSRALN